VRKLVTVILCLALTNVFSMSSAIADECSFEQMAWDGQCSIDLSSAEILFLKQQRDVLDARVANQSGFLKQLSLIAETSAQFTKFDSFSSLSNSLVEQIETYNGRRVSLAAALAKLREEATVIESNSQSKSGVVFVPSLYKQLVGENRSDISLEAWEAGQNSRAKIVSYELPDYFPAKPGMPFSVRLVVDSELPYMITAGASGIDKAISLGWSNSIAVWRRGGNSQKEIEALTSGRYFVFGEKVSYDTNQTIGLVESRTIQGKITRDTWIIKFTTPERPMGRFELFLQERRNTDCLAVVFMEEDQSQRSCLNQFVRKELQDVSGIDSLGGHFLDVYQKYEDSLALSTLLARKPYIYPSTLQAKASTLLAEARSILKVSDLIQKNVITYQAQLLNKKKRSTIICINGKFVKRVSGVSPKCPPGYRKR